MNRILIALSVYVLLAGTAYAESAEDRSPRHERRGPPEAALEACSSLVAGDPCSFEGRGETVQGTCQGPEDRPLACAPEGEPQREKLERRKS